MIIFFFFSSRRRHTRLQGDWSSDVCSSDLAERAILLVRCSSLISMSLRCTRQHVALARVRHQVRQTCGLRAHHRTRSEERRVGKEGRSRRGGGEEKSKSQNNTKVGVQCGE